ncbi:MAG TPA: TRAP transporter large permease, partial [Clostridia bacterium]|nr:TRAP transporter large permease [Clostridia bacterium]
MIVALVLFVALLILLAVGFPISYALGFGALSALVVKGSIPLMVVPQRLFASTDQFALLAVPFFILAGEIMLQGGISRRLVNFANDLLGWLAGGLALVSVAAATFFSAISGSSAATTAAIGSVMYPEMIKRGYRSDYAAVIQAVGGTLGVVLPPSIPFIIYGVITETSIGDLFLAGIFPGLLGALVYMALSWAICKRKGYGERRASSIGYIGGENRSLWKSFWEAFPGLLMPVIVLGGIYGSIFTPTESAVVAVVYALLVSFVVYRELDYRKLFSLFNKAALTSAMVMMLIAAASLFTWVMTIENMPRMIGNAVLALAGSKLVFLLLVNLIFLVTGMFLDTVAIILLLIPIFFPIAMQMGIDPVHFGVIAVFNLAV